MIPWRSGNSPPGLLGKELKRCHTSASRSGRLPGDEIPIGRLAEPLRCPASDEHIRQAPTPGNGLIAAIRQGIAKATNRLMPGIIANNWASRFARKRTPTRLLDKEPASIRAFPKATSAQKYIKIAQGLCLLNVG
jgi:hypothetical protein